MPSSLIIVALAAAWLVVLVPMVARKRQQVSRTPSSALAARVVRSGARNEGQEEFTVSDSAKPSVEDDLAELEAELDSDLDEDLEDETGPLPQPGATVRDEPARPRSGGYRPGRGGFDPEAAEIAARAKYAFRQRVVVILLVLAVATAAFAGFAMSVVWWGHALVDVALAGYLVYLRRQVRIENEIRQRRMARYASAPRAPRREEPLAPPEPAPAEPDFEVVAPPTREVVERKPSPMSRIRRQAVVVDLDDEDPAFEELDEPGTSPYRRAVGE